MKEGLPEIFEVVVRRHGEVLRIEVDSPAGQGAAGLSLNLARLAADPGERRDCRNVARRPESAAAAREDFGGELFAALFGGPLGQLLSASLTLAAERGKNLRWIWKLDEAPDFAVLPLERLSDGRRCFAIDPRSPVVRSLPALAAPRPAVELPFRCLVVAACPPGAVPIDVEGELKAIAEAFAPLVRRGRVTIEHHRNASLTELGRRLRDRSFHLLHFIGHGAFLDDGCLVLEADRQGSEIAERQRLEVLLGPHDSLRLVVLNCCSSAEVDPAAPRSGLAQAISRLDVPAVVGMQNPLSDRAAVDFAAAFYGALAAGRPIDVAANLGRQAMRLENRLPEDWSAPVVFLRNAREAVAGVTLPPAPPPILPARLGAWAADRLLDRPGRDARALALGLAAAILLAALMGSWFAGRLFYQSIDEAHVARADERLVGLSSLLLFPLAFETWRGGATQLWRRGSPIAVTLASLAALASFWTFLLWLVLDR